MKKKQICDFCGKDIPQSKFFCLECYGDGINDQLRPLVSTKSNILLDFAKKRNIKVKNIRLV